MFITYYTTAIPSNNQTLANLVGQKSKGIIYNLVFMIEGSSTTTAAANLTLYDNTAGTNIYSIASLSTSTSDVMSQYSIPNNNIGRFILGGTESLRITGVSNIAGFKFYCLMEIVPA